MVIFFEDIVIKTKTCCEAPENFGIGERFTYRWDCRLGTLQVALAVGGIDIITWPSPDRSCTL